MKLDYLEMISPYGVSLNIGTIHKPKLCEIADSKKLGFKQFRLYETLLFLTPRDYFRNYADDERKAIWDSMPKDEQNKISIFQIMETDEVIRELYLMLFNYFFEEKVEYKSGVFVVFKNRDVDLSSITKDDIQGIITKELFPDILDILKQLCGMTSGNNEFADLSTKKFKNEKARKMAEKMQLAAIQESEQKKANPNLALPNIISKVCARHPSINYTNVWDLTLYELMDNFTAIQNNEMFDILKTSVSVWGDEKKRFNGDGWYKNQFDS